MGNPMNPVKLKETKSYFKMVDCVQGQGADSI